MRGEPGDYGLNNFMMPLTFMESSFKVISIYGANLLKEKCGSKIVYLYVNYRREKSKRGEC